MFFERGSKPYINHTVFLLHVLVSLRSMPKGPLPNLLIFSLLFLSSNSKRRSILSLTSHKQLLSHERDMSSRYVYYLYLLKIYIFLCISKTQNVHLSNGSFLSIIFIHNQVDSSYINYQGLHPSVHPCGPRSNYLIAPADV